jgi:DUF4097 and DUF4098 domain-containing protein YvlB
MKTKLTFKQVHWISLAVLSLFAISEVQAARGAITESNLHKVFTVKPGGQLIMDVDRGPIEIVTRDTGEVEVEVERKFTKGNAAKANEVFGSHEVSFDQDGDRVEVRAKFKKDFLKIFNREPMNFQVKYRVTMPLRFNVDLRTSAGEISATDIEGSVKARTAGGSLRFAVVNGTMEGQTSAGSIEVQSVSGTTRVNTAGGSISLGRVDGETTAETSAGSVKVKRAGAQLTALTHGGSLELGELVGPARLETSAGSISIDDARGKLIAITHGGKIDAGELAAPAELSTSAGSIHVKVARGALVAKTSGGEVSIGDARDTITAHTSAGSIHAKISAQPQGDCELTTSGGPIVLTLSGTLAFDLDARTSGGAVNTEIPVLTTVVGENKKSGLKGKINGGGKELVLKTSAGDITIRKE